MSASSDKNEAELVIHWEEAHFRTNVTAQFEAFLVYQQSLGRRPLAWKNMGNNKYHVMVSKIELLEEGIRKEMIDNSKTVSWLHPGANVQLAPWEVYFFDTSHLRRNISLGQVFSTVTLATQYAELMRVGDPVELVRIDGMAHIGFCKLVGINRTVVRLLKAEDFSAFREIFGPERAQAEDFRQALAEMYAQPVNMETEVVVLTLEASEPIISRRVPPKRWFVRILRRMLRWYEG